MTKHFIALFIDIFDNKHIMILKIIFTDICINIWEKLHVNIFCSSIANLKCTPSDWRMYPQECMYPRLGTPELDQGIPVIGICCPILVGKTHSSSFAESNVDYCRSSCSSCLNGKSPVVNVILCSLQVS